MKCTVIGRQQLRKAFVRLREIEEALAPTSQEKSQLIILAKILFTLIVLGGLQ